MRAGTLSCHKAFNRPYFCCPSTPPASFRLQQLNVPFLSSLHTIGRGRFHHLKCIAAVDRGSTESISSWDDEPYEVLPNGEIAYLDEQDVVTFLDPPKELIPLDPSSYNPATYLWKKIESIPLKRRNQLLSLLQPRLISRAWEIAGMRYDDPKLATKSASSLLGDGNEAMSLEFWNCRTEGGPLPIAWIQFFRKALFNSKQGKLYGRLIEQPCDFAYEFGDGLLDLKDYPQGFPNPAKHPWPFSDQVVIYIRHLGPGVLVGQAWQEGKALEQVPKKLCKEILMVKDYSV